MRTATLDTGRIDAYLTRLGSPPVRHDAAGLATLQAAHLMAVPFHNLLLLANDGRPLGLPALQEVVDGAIAGVGGNCDRTTPPFTALLEAIGFDARLAAATVREPGDHFVCIVATEGRRFLCDVGNGHPYLSPWDLDGSVQEQSFHGWRFRFDPGALAGPTLKREIPGAGWKTVYVIDPGSRAYADFAPMVQAHYGQAGFGPFLSGLRAVRIQADAVLTLRDHEYARDTRFGRSLRVIAGADAASALLVERFGLPAQLVQQALGVAARRRPDLFVGEPHWHALGRGRIEDSSHVERPTREVVPDILVSLATIGRGPSVQRLLDSLDLEVRASGYPGRVGVLIVENHLPSEERGWRAPDTINVHPVPIEALRPALERAARVGILPPPNGQLPVPIGAAREAQLAAIREHLSVGVPGLPHPGLHPTIVWMVDDDLTFQQLCHDGERRHTNLLFRAARYWSALPQHAVVLGTFTGDPPVPGLDCLGGQLHDLTGSVAAILEVGPTVLWNSPPSPPAIFDAYYDLTEAPGQDDRITWKYGRSLVGRPARTVALALLRDLGQLLDGKQITRPLVWDGQDSGPHRSVRRGGNTLFLDLDALFRWPTPVAQSADGTRTRRADSIWAALASSEDPGAVVEVTLPLHHERRGQGSPAADSTLAPHLGAQTTEQVRGVVLARALTERRPVSTELPARERRVVAHRAVLRRGIAVLRDAILELRRWQDEEIDEAVRSAMPVLDELDRMVREGTPQAGDPAELDRFLARLPQAVRAWREAW